MNESDGAVKALLRDMGNGGLSATAIVDLSRVRMLGGMSDAPYFIPPQDLFDRIKSSGWVIRPAWY